MKKITFLTIIICSLISFTAKSQYSGEKNNYNNDYNRARREVQKEYETQADRNRQPNSPSGNYNTSLSPAELQSLEDMLRKAAGKPTRAEENARKTKEDSIRLKKHEAFKKKEAAERAVWEK